MGERKIGSRASLRTSGLPSPIEMAHTLEGVEQKLTADPTYQAEFETAFGPGPITYAKVEKAISSFEAP